MSDVLNGRPLRHLEVDVERYQKFLDDAKLNETERREFLAAIWSVITAFVDLGFEVHPVQQVCGQDRNDTPEIDDVPSRDGVISTLNEKQGRRKTELDASVEWAQDFEGLRNEPN